MTPDFLSGPDDLRGPCNERPGQDQTTPPTNDPTILIVGSSEGADFPASHQTSDTQFRRAGGETIPAGQPIVDTPSTGHAVDLLDPTLMLAADVVDDLERVKIANQNRLRTLTTPFEDGGAGLSEAHPDVARLAGMVQAMEKLEHDAILQLQRTMRRHPLGPWVKAQKGVGEKQAARLLAAIGDPYINSATGQPRTVSALWAYSGLHTLPPGHVSTDAQHAPAGGNQISDPSHMSSETPAGIAWVAAKRRKGVKANWSANAKSRAYLIAVSCMKQKPGNQFRDIYDKRRAHTSVTHPDWTDGHSHNDALRIVSKEILKSLWVAARDLHQGAATA